MSRVVIALIACFGASMVALALPRSDATRQARVLDQELVFLPSAQGVRVASSGFEEVVADLMWVRTVLLFGGRYDTDDSLVWKEWLAGMVNTVTELDPQWRTPYQYGGGMLVVIGQIDASSTVYEKCSRERPEEFWCPFARGMNDSLYKDDQISAGIWLREAAQRPGAPKWYGSAAAALASKGGQRHAGLVYLEEQLGSATDPGVRKNLEYQRNKLRHDELVATWEQEAKAWRDQHGPLERPEDLAKLGFVLPENPRGDAWVVGRDSVVRSEQSERDRERRARMDEWLLIRR